MVAQLSTGRSIAVLAVVIGCFAILWPKLFLPLFRESVSLNSKAVSSDKNDLSMMHPRLKQLLHDSNNNVNVIRSQTSRPFPTMGARHAKSVPQKQGAMGFVMPLYTIGIIVFFLYTILKIAVRGNENEQPEREQPPFPDEHILAKTAIDRNLCKLLFSNDYKKEMVKQFKDNCRMFFDETRRLNEKRERSMLNEEKEEDEKDLEIKELKRKLAEKELLMNLIFRQNDYETENNLNDDNVTKQNTDHQSNKESTSDNDIETSNICEEQQKSENTESSEEENEEESFDSSEEFESESEKQIGEQNSWTPLFTEE